MIRVGFTGLPGSGKSYLVRMFSTLFKYNGKYMNTEIVSEYARTYLARYGSIDNIWEQYKLLDKQLQLEDSVSKSVELLITDSPLPLYFQYLLDLRDTSNVKDTMVVKDIFQKLSSLNTPPRYDIIFHLPPAIDPVNDGVRPKEHLDPVWRKGADEGIRFICSRLFPPRKWIEVEPVDLMERANFCVEKLTEYLNTKPKVEQKTVLDKIPTRANIGDFIKFTSKIEINGKSAEEMEREQKEKENGNGI